MKTIRFTAEALADLKRHASVGRRVLKALDRYAEGGRADVVIMIDGSGRSRMRVGAFRAIFTETETALLVHKIGPRGSVYGD